MVSVPVQPWCPMVLGEDCVPKYQQRWLSPSRHQPRPQLAASSFLGAVKASITLREK